MNRFRCHWRIDPEIDFLNHGSFGACPLPVLDAQQRMREEMERQPVEFLARRLGGRLDEARVKLAAFLGADPAGLAPLPNATTAVSTVLRSIKLSPGDELLATDHAYNACRNALECVARRRGARVVVARVPFAVAAPEEVSRAVLTAVTPRTRLALIEHVTSPTGVIFPVEHLVGALAARGIDALVDGAHAPGMVPLDLGGLGAAYYTGNAHKWLCAPKGAAFLWVREDLRERTRPLSISHGAHSRRPGRSRFHDEFDWTGTDDPSAFLCVPVAIEFLGSLVDGGWPQIRRQNHELAVLARSILAEALEVEPPCPDEMIGSLATLPLPDGPDSLQAMLLRRHRIEVQIVAWPAPPKRVLRVSAQLYNDVEQYRRLAAALKSELS